MKKYVMLVFMLTVVGMSNAAVVMLDDFNGYANDAALQAVWVMNTGGSDIATETLVTDTTVPVLNGSQCMLITNVSTVKYYAQTKLALAGAEHNVHGVNLTSAYPGATGITMTFAVPLNNASAPYGTLGGSGGDVLLSMYDCWGQKVFSASYPGDVTPSGTGMPAGIVWDLDFAAYTVAGMNLENVEQITVGYNNAYYGAGAMFVDNVGFIVPEPATMALFGLGALAFFKRR